MTENKTSVTWIGHATVLIEIGGLKILTDPALTSSLAHLRRHYEVDAELIKGIDLVLISHMHMDHTHLPSLKKISSETPLVVPIGSKSFFEKKGISNVIELDIGETSQFNGVSIEAVLAEHQGHRFPLTSKASPALGYVISNESTRIYFAGDTDIFDDMNKLAPIDIAMIPIGGWASKLGAGHLNPERAAKAVEIIQPKVVVPIHWGTYSSRWVSNKQPKWLNQPAEEFSKHLAQLGLLDKAMILKPGESKFTLEN